MGGDHHQVDDACSNTPSTVNSGMLGMIWDDDHHQVDDACSNTPSSVNSGMLGMIWDDDRQVDRNVNLLHVLVTSRTFL